MAGSAPGPGVIVLLLVVVACVVLSIVGIVMGATRDPDEDPKVKELAEPLEAWFMANAEVPWESVTLEGCTASGRTLSIPEGATCTLEVPGAPEGRVQTLELDPQGATVEVSSEVGEGSMLGDLQEGKSRSEAVRVAVDEAGVELRVLCVSGTDDRCLVRVGG